MRPSRTVQIALSVTIAFGFMVGTALATPSANVFYLESDVGEGLWKYEYFLHNTSDPGYNLFWFTLNLGSTVTLSSISPPQNWDSTSDYSTYIDWVSVPDGDSYPGDIIPGGLLSGFSFTSDTRLALLYFDVFLSNPTGGDPILFSGSTAAIPEPGTLLLLGGGLAGLGYLRGRRFLLVSP